MNPPAYAMEDMDMSIHSALTNIINKAKITQLNRRLRRRRLFLLGGGTHA